MEVLGTRLEVLLSVVLGSRLMDLFPRLFALESFKDCKISDRWICSDGIWSGNWAWRSPPRGRALDELTNLVSCIGNLTLDGEGIDKWSWADEASGIFKVNTLSKKIQNLSLNNFVLASLDRLPSRANLSIRGIVLSSTSCPFCDIALKDIEHSLFSVSDIALGNLSIPSNWCSRLSKVVKGVFQCSIWAIWKWRNKLVTSDSDSSSIIKDQDIFPSIQRLSKIWISARLASNLVNWNCWIARPFDIFM
ncbi:hypothetical protein Tco_0624499 [Tanacetum coccineum]|uniref:Uncharacterized protein n=1 Tax=Tanacetum coccineum TaxID=301880 RepID=A0ABQ4WE24_9ASTR